MDQAGGGDPVQAASHRTGRSRVPLRWRALAGAAAVAVVAVALSTAPDPSPAPDTAANASRDTDNPDAAAPQSALPEGFEPVTPSTAPVTFDHTSSDPVDPAVSGGLRFTDVTADAGLAEEHLGRDISEGEDMSGGAAAGDFDDDGHVDIYVTRIGRPNLLYLNNGDGTFTDVAAEAGVQGTDWITGYSGAVFADVDGDDHLDLLVTSVSGAATLLYINQGDGTFTEEAADRGLALDIDADLVPPRNFSATFADWDGDGTLDLALADWYNAHTAAFANAAIPGMDPDLPVRLGNDQCARADFIEMHGNHAADGFHEPRTRLLRNDGTGHFTDVTTEMGIDPGASAAFMLTFADHDGDGWPDLFVAGDFCTSRLYRNDGGQGFTDVTDAAGVGTDENGMGQAIEDLNGDGLLDWVVSSIYFPPALGECPTAVTGVGCTGNRVFLNRGNGTFDDATDHYGMRDGFWGWGTVAEDLTNRGARDLVVTAGWAQAGLHSEMYEDPVHIVHRRSAGSPSRLWINTGDGPWPEVADQVGFTDRSNGKALLALDYDGDGLLDLLKINTEAPPVLYRNTSSRAPDRHWLGIALRDDTTANRRGIGATITVVDSEGVDRVTEMRAGATFQGGDPDQRHIGLGPADGPTTVQVRWPGTESTEEFEVSTPDQVVTLRRGEGR